MDEHMKNEAEYPALYPSEYPAATVVTRTPTVWCDTKTITCVTTMKQPLVTNEDD